MNAPVHLHFLVPGLSYINESSFAKGLAVPALRTLLTRANRQPILESSAQSWLCSRLANKVEAECSVAPYSLLAENGAPGEDYWLKADPVHLRVHGDQLILLDSSVLAITADESAAMVTSLNEHFKSDGLRFYSPSPDNWYCATERLSLFTHPIDQVVGKNINCYLPHGSDAAKWNGISNEIQMLLFSHPVNQQREINQKLTINSVWFWGGGTLDKALPAQSLTLFTSNLFARGLGLAANINVLPVPVSAAELLNLNTAQQPLVILESLVTASQYGDIPAWRAAILDLERQWFGPIVAALKRNKVASVSINAFGGNKNRVYKISRGDLWKFWRRGI